MSEWNTGFIYERPKIDPEDVKELYLTMSELVYADMDKQYKEMKISGATYANTYAELMKAVVAGAMTTVAAVMNKETPHDRLVKEKTAYKLHEEGELVDAKTMGEDIKNGQKIMPDSLYGKNIAVAAAQEELYIRQKLGFDDNANQKYLDSITGPYSILFQDLDLDSAGLPDAFTKNGVDSAVLRITTGLDSA